MRHDVKQHFNECIKSKPQRETRTETWSWNGLSRPRDIVGRLGQKHGLGTVYHGLGMLQALYAASRIRVIVWLVYGLTLNMLASLNKEVIIIIINWIN